ncbi:MAG: peptidoglycan-binding protein, partial [Clostridia bacterium]|nr:peptidoglycan-binding protein [Clostridia bacterium]
MAIGNPTIPQSITVHLGAPDAPARNVTLSFSDYIKNVASSEIYPTWEVAALRANIFAQISYALNRVYTEFYRSRGYPFDITSSTAYDQKFIEGRNIFENIDRLVSSIFDSYLRRQGFIEPLAAKYCNGTTVTCQGLSQWGSEYQARAGNSDIQILRNYYGNDIELVTDVPVRGLTESYPGFALRRGSRGREVQIVQTMLNRISQNYPSIPKNKTVDGIFGEITEQAITRFQRIFNLAPDGVVGRATWYKMVQIYTGIV